MLQHNLHIAWRQWRSGISWSLINLGGLTAGLTVALLIGLWISGELSFDHYFPSHARIVKVTVTKPSDAGLVTSDLQPPPLIDELRANHNRFFRRLAIVFPNFPHALTAGQRHITAEGQWAQPEWPDILSLHMIRGSRDALNDPSSTLIDQSTATALFGKADPTNHIIRIDNAVNVKVAGVYEDLPANTSFAGTHILLAWAKAAEEMSWFKDAQQDWGGAGWWIFGELNDANDQARADKDIRTILQNHIKGSKDQLSLYPMDRWHLYSEFHDGKSTTGRIRIVLLFTAIGIFVLLLACINFMNLSTARSERRAREVGIRKTLGSLRYQLIIQFLTESVSLSLLALILAIGLAQLILPFFNHLAGKHLALPYTNPSFWLITVSFTLFTGLISGSYPALYLSHFRPTQVLTNRYRSTNTASIARKSLVVLQFTVSVTLIIATAIIYRQIEYAKARPVGYDRDGLIVIRMNTSDIYSTNYNSLRDDLLRSGAAINMAQSSDAATEQPPNWDGISWDGKDPSSRPPFIGNGITHDFGSTIKWTITAGRDFSRDFATDSTAILINESAARLIGWKDPIGRTIRFWDSDHRIIGVAKDIVNGSPYQPVTPTIFTLDYHVVNYITIRMNPAQPVNTALNTIAGIFKRYNPQSSFDYRFLADEYSLKFAAEQQVGRLATVFAILAIFISCLGLFGLASYMTEQRIKEIGIRKVLGATVTQLITLLSTDFLKLILIALTIAIPLSAWTMHLWLQSYPYRTHLSPWIFTAAAAGAIGIALLTISFQAVRAALANPVTSLRAE
jgi:ABC-type antimicrobial peptide transport system permease subunit